jgi:hypothetical protein
VNLGGVFQSIGDAGNQFGAAQIAAQKQKMQQILDQLGIDQGKLAIEQGKKNLEKEDLGMEEIRQRMQQMGLPQIHGTFTTPDGGVYALMRDPKTGDVTQKQLRPGNKYPTFRTLQEMEAYAISTGDKELLQSAQEAIKATQKTPNVPATTQEYEDWKEAFKAKHGREPNDSEIEQYRRNKTGSSGTGGGGGDDRVLKALADKWMNDGIKPPAKLQASVETYMEEHGMHPKVKLTSQEQGLLDLTKQMEPKVESLKKIIEDAGLSNSGGTWDAIKQQAKFYEYKAGIKPDQLHADLIKAAAALQVMGAGPWTKLGRGKYLYETIKQHLPSPTDSPALLYDKVQFLQSIIDDAQASIPKTEGAAQPQPQPQGNGAPPPGSQIVTLDEFLKH